MRQEAYLTFHVTVLRVEREINFHVFFTVYFFHIFLSRFYYHLTLRQAYEIFHFLFSLSLSMKMNVKQNVDELQSTTALNLSLALYKEEEKKLIKRKKGREKKKKDSAFCTHERRTRRNYDREFFFFSLILFKVQLNQPTYSFRDNWIQINAS